MPFKSKAQRRKFYALKAEGKMSQNMINEWESHTPDRLPERLGHQKSAQILKLTLEKSAEVAREAATMPILPTASHIPPSSIVGATHAIAGIPTGAASAALGAPENKRLQASAGSTVGSYLGGAAGAATGAVGGAVGGAALGYGLGHMFSESPTKDHVLGSLLGTAGGLGAGAYLGYLFKSKPAGIIASMLSAPIAGYIGGQAFAADTEQHNRLKQLIGAVTGATAGGASGGKAGALIGTFLGGKAGYEYGAR